MKKQLILSILFLIFTTYAGRIRESKLLKNQPESVSNEKSSGTIVRTPLSLNLIEEAFTLFLQSWNAKDLDSVLAETMHDKEDIKRAVEKSYPGFARAQLIEIESYRILNQRQFTQDKQEYLKSVVLLTAKVRVETNDPQLGFEKMNGTNQYTLEIVTTGE